MRLLGNLVAVIVRLDDDVGWRTPSTNGALVHHYNHDTHIRRHGARSSNNPTRGAFGIQIRHGIRGRRHGRVDCCRLEYLVRSVRLHAR